MEINLDFAFHPKQYEIYDCPKRFRTVAAGRRFGKSYMAAAECLISALQDTNEHGYRLAGKPVWYIAPTWKQGMDAVWHYLNDLGKDVIVGTREKDGVIKLINGAQIHIKGSDRPDTLRGSGLRFAVLDEFASMKPETWDQIISPALADVKGRALFIGTPHFTAPHFRELWEMARRTEEEGKGDWAAFTYTTADNPHIDATAEIERMRTAGVPEAVIRQEMYASFNAMGDKALDPNKIIMIDRPPFGGETYIMVDPAGYSEEGKGLVSNRRDETAIAVVVVAQQGWFIQDIIHGRWGVRDTALKVIATAAKYRPRAVGIEKGSLKNALMPYLEDRMRQLSVYPTIMPLTHGGQKKTERILWAWQGRLESGRIFCQVAPWNQHLFGQMLDFPNKFAHDDLIDAVAYCDQIAQTPFFGTVDMSSNFEIIDQDAGY